MKLGKVKLYIETEKLSNSVTATAYPLDQGEPITDHVQQQPQTLSIDGWILSGSSYKAELQYLRDNMRKGTLLNYTGRTICKNVIITSIDDTRTGNVANGSAVSIQLQFIRIVKEKWSNTKAKAKAKKKTVGKKKKTVKKKTSKKYVKIYRGMTYWATARKYGTTVSALEKLNPWPARKIPYPTKKKMRIR
ncbi:LysM domain-containing protein [Sporolactobacillus shoreicorticis]|uniref:Phage baseplate protein n=1 Tax=Sporolactobacillus shoreicorticis TaxID=1923877 RepID=A0ABW5S601_9BACL|nr:LysM domain-containing protein [Sporolactobacillus shoreicorticis]MCO7127820.1 LysM domain-containing protein [Sporolactobacillus shoreicorticis]